MKNGRFIVYTEPHELSKMLLSHGDERAAWRQYWGNKTILLPGFHDGMPFSRPNAHIPVPCCHVQAPKRLNVASRCR